MASAFQNRLVGSVVLVALAVLVLPEFLDGEKATLEQQFATIPLRPTVEVVEPQLPIESVEVKSQAASGSEVNDDAMADNSVTVSSPSQPEPTKAVAKPTPEVKRPAAAAESKPQPKGWSVRLGSFKNAANVNALVAKLRKQNYPAYTIPATPVDGQLTRVMVGPDSDKARLEKIRAELAKGFKMNGQIVAYDPLQL